MLNQGDFMRIAILVSSLAVFVVIICGCSSHGGPQIIKRDKDSVTVMHQGRTLKIKPEGTAPEKGKGFKKDGVMIYTDDTNPEMKVIQGKNETVDVPPQDWTRESSDGSNPGPSTPQE
jgi:hypothetical protein